MKNKSSIVIFLILIISASSCAAEGKNIYSESSTGRNTEIVVETDNTVSDNNVSEIIINSEKQAEESMVPQISQKESLQSNYSHADNSNAENKNQISSQSESTVHKTSKVESSKPATTTSQPSSQESSQAETKQESSQNEPNKESLHTESRQESSQTEPKKEPSDIEPSKQESSNPVKKPNSEIQTNSSESAAPEIKSSRSKVDQIDISWNAVEGADGYIIHYSTLNDLTPKNCWIVETTDTKATLKNLKLNSKYYYHVCAFKKKETGQKITSEWSKTYSEELKSIKVVDGVTYADGILIANKTYSLPSDFGNGLEPEAYNAFNRMARDAANDGIYLYIISDFRSYWTQSYTYNSFVYDRGVEQADRCSARPGHSEHQTGLAIDVNTTSDYFDGTPEAIWLANNCVRYGFIIRYPRGKESVTGYKYEPWHIRYLGAQKAAEIANSGLTIEEYYGITSFYS